MNPIDLKAEYGGKWQIGLDEAAGGRWADPWNYIVRCRHGHLYPVDQERIGAATDRAGAIVKKLRSIDGVEILQDGEDGCNAVFHRAKLRYIARVMRPRSVRQLSPAQRAALARGRLQKNPLE